MTASGGAAPVKTPWWKKWWIWAIVAAVILIGVIGNLAGAGKPAATETTAPPTPTITQAAPAPEESTPEPTGPTDEELSARFAQALSDSMGGATPAETFATDPSLWYGWVAGSRVENGNAYVTLQVGSGDAERKDLGERAAMALATLLPESAVNGIGWIIVEDASGVVIAQTRPNPVP